MVLMRRAPASSRSLPSCRLPFFSGPALFQSCQSITLSTRDTLQLLLVPLSNDSHAGDWKLSLQLSQWAGRQSDISMLSCPLDLLNPVQWELTLTQCELDNWLVCLRIYQSDHSHSNAIWYRWNLLAYCKEAPWPSLLSWGETSLKIR